MSDRDTINAIVQRVAVPAPPDGLQQLAAAVLTSHATPELRAALHVAAEVRSRSVQRRGVLRRQADELRLQLAQIEHQLTG